MEVGIIYRFLADGSIEKVYTTAKTGEELVGKDDHEYTHMLALDDELIFIVHTDNDIKDYYDNTELPINKAIQKYYPNSKIVGDAILVQIDDTDHIILEDFDIDRLSNYEIYDISESFPTGVFRNIYTDDD